MDAHLLELARVLTTRRDRTDEARLMSIFMLFPQTITPMASR